MNALADLLQPIQKLNIERRIIPEYSNFPNNALLPVLVYRAAIQFPQERNTDAVREILESNNWSNSWIDGIFDYHHYHATTHETLVGLTGSCQVQFGGPDGTALTLEPGDVVVIPAGVAHKRIDKAGGFTCMGAYPGGQQYDIRYGRDGERPAADADIRNVPMPESDPLYGNDGPLIKNWGNAANQNHPLL